MQQLLSQAKTYIDIAPLAKGIYFIKLKNKDCVYIEKFMKE